MPERNCLLMGYLKSERPATPKDCTSGSKPENLVQVKILSTPTKMLADLTFILLNKFWSKL